MTLFSDKTDFAQHILVRSFLDLDLLEPYIEVALRRKILPFIPLSVIEAIAEDTALMGLLKKAVAHYALPIAIPFLKVHLSNAGINTVSDNKLQNAEWWDVRDMALQSSVIADEALTDLIDELLLTVHRNDLSFLNSYDGIIFKTPDEFYKLTGIGHGYELFQLIMPSIEHIWHTIIVDKIPACVLDDYADRAELLLLLQKAVAFYALADITSSGGVVFTRSGLFVVWEQLPWQKSAVLTDAQLAHLRASYMAKANRFMELIWKYIHLHAVEYPCLADIAPQSRKVITKKSGLYF
ncbi:MAG: hypothetical protein Q4F57_02530 [Weeksellaceae bacterium]|nr:hypothetical protein [Weeksellaceae bacterium]